MSDWKDELETALMEGEVAGIRERLALKKRILRIEAGKGMQKSANWLAWFIARTMFDTGVVMKKLGLIPADENMPASQLIGIILNCIENGTADRIWADPRRGPKHPDPDVMWEVWGQVKVAHETMVFRSNATSDGAFETVAKIRMSSLTFPWAIDTIEKYYKNCQKT